MQRTFVTLASYPLAQLKYSILWDISREQPWIKCEVGQCAHSIKKTRKLIQLSINKYEIKKHKLKAHSKPTLDYYVKTATCSALGNTGIPNNSQKYFCTF